MSLRRDAGKLPPGIKKCPAVKCAVSLHAIFRWTSVFPLVRPHSPLCRKSKAVWNFFILTVLWITSFSVKELLCLKTAAEEELSAAVHKAHVHKRSEERRSVIGLLTRDFRGLPHAGSAVFSGLRPMTGFRHALQAPSLTAIRTRSLRPNERGSYAGMSGFAPVPTPSSQDRRCFMTQHL